MIDNINAISLTVRDVARCALFYRETLGFDLKQLDHDEADLRIGSDDGIVNALNSVDLVASDVSEQRTQPRQESIDRTLCVVLVKDVDAGYSGLSRNEVHFIHPPPKILGDRFRTAYFEDPYGNLWEIAKFMDE